MNLIVASPEEVVERVKQYQDSNGCTDQKMAELIGCSRPIYNQTLNGKIKVGNTFFYGAVRFLSSVANGRRTSVVKRETAETNIAVELDVDGSGRYEINTRIDMLDHLLSQLARHGVFDIKLTAAGNDPHHITEDVAICLGQAFRKALGEKRGIVRIADSTVPMDDALATVILDISGRGYTHLEMTFVKNDMSGFSTDLIRHFLESFAIEAKINLHAAIAAYSQNDHHRAEALFKALGRALDMATRIDERISDELPSTKEFLEG